MSLSFPVPANEFTGLLKVASLKWDLAEYYQEFGTAMGQIGRNEIAAPKWTAEITTAPLEIDEARKINAIMRRIGPYGFFNLTNPMAPFPIADPNGSILGDASVTIYDVGARAVRLAGLPQHYRLQWGDMFSVTYGSSPTRQALFEVADDVTVPVSGISPWMEITPPPKAGVVEGLAVRLKQPIARMMFASRDPGIAEALHVTGASISAIEAPLAAG